MRIVLQISCQNCAAFFITEIHTFEAVLPLFIKMSLNYNSDYAFHVLSD